MNICYLLASSDLWGGVRVVFDQARALRKRGHDVVIRALSGDHSWYPYDVSLDYVSDLSVPFGTPGRPGPDVLIATFWTTVETALRLNCPSTFHLCQGFEGDNIEYAGMTQAIEDVYRLPVPKLVIGDWLSKRLIQLFGPEAFKIYVVGQIVDLDMYRPLPFWRRLSSRGASRKTRILVSGLFDAAVKAIPDALRAVSVLRGKGVDVHLTRVSAVNTYDRECLVADIDEYHCKISPQEMADIYRSNDLFMTSSLSHEGFGLPFAEALACGVPAVATAIPSYLSFDTHHDYALFVPEKDPSAMAEAAIEIMADKKLRERLRKRGHEIVTRNFRGDIVAKKMESVFLQYLNI